MYSAVRKSRFLFAYMIHLFHVVLVNVSMSLCAYQEDTPRPAAPGAPGQAPRPAGAPAARP